VVLVEQHVGLALEIADRAMVLVHGDVQLDRPASELIAEPELLEAAYFGQDARDHAEASAEPTGAPAPPPSTNHV